MNLVLYHLLFSTWNIDIIIIGFMFYTLALVIL